MLWFYLAAGSVLFFTTLNLMQRKLAVESEDPRAMTIVYNSYAAVIACILFVLMGSHKNFSLPSTFAAWLVVLAASFFFGMFERGRFFAAKEIDASTLTTIGNLSVLVAFVGALFLYSEALTINKIFGGLAIVGALILVSISKTKRKSSLKGILIAILINLSLGLGWMLDKKGALYFNAETYSILVWTIPILFIYFPSVNLTNTRKVIKAGSWKLFVLALINVIGYLLQLKAVTMQEASRVIPIVQTSTLLTILMGIILLKERENLLRKILAGAIAFLGVYLLL